MVTVPQGFDDVSTQARPAGSMQFLTFILDGEEYGVDILRVQEIKGWDNATPLPNTPAYIRGVMNLRGTIVPIIDLRRRFRLEEIPYGPTTVIIVLRVAGRDDEQERVLGIVVDAVSDVYNLSPDAVKAPPDFGTSIDIDFIGGLASVDEKMLILLDADRLLRHDELDGIERIQNRAAAAEAVVPATIQR